VHPGDAAWVAVAADVPEVEHVGGGDILELSRGSVGDDAVANGGSEIIEEDSVEGALGGVGGAADGLAAEEADAGGSGGGGEELGEEIAIDGDLTKDEALGSVEVDLGGGIEGPGFGTGTILEGALGEAIPGGVGGLGLGDDAGADGALGQMLDEVGGDAEIIVKPAGFLEEGEAGLGWGFAPGLKGVEDDETALAGELCGFESGGFRWAACAWAGSAAI